MAAPPPPLLSAPPPEDLLVYLANHFLSNRDAVTLSHADHEVAERLVALAEPRWEVEAIVGRRRWRGQEQFLVKWVGYVRKTWEPAANMRAQVPEAVRAYERTVTQR